LTKPILYGVSISRALRSIWAIEEVGIDYDHVPTHFFKDTKTPEFLSINPNGRVPTLVDGELMLCESMAINLYLAERYGDGLWPESIEDRARTQQWSVWGISEIEPLQMRIVIQKLFTKEEHRDEDAINESAKGLGRPLAVLDAHLANQSYLLGDRFTIADLNVSGVMLLFQMIEFDVSAYPNVTRWTDDCYARPSLAAARARD